MYQNYTVGVGGACERYDPPYSPWCSGDFYLLRQFPEMHTRSPSGVRAEPRLPHSHKYTKASHVGAVVHAWRPGHWYTWMFGIGPDVEPAHKVKEWVVYPNTNAISGRVPDGPKSNASGVTYLGDFNSEDGCFAACNASASCQSWAWHRPDFVAPDWAHGCYAITDGSWQDVAQDGVVSARGPHDDGVGYVFNAGGHQGGEGNEEAGEWYISNVKEECDAPNEFFYDEAAQLLYFYANASGAGSPGSAIGQPDSSVVVPTLSTFFSIAGTKERPATGITIDGLTITASRPTFMEPRTNPSGGDWSLERQGAIKLEGTERVSILNSYFTRLDSNAISINGYNRHATVDHNEFVWLGQSAITSWGYTEDNDGTNGEQPRFSSITNNLCHEIGHYQKQSSFYFQATTAQATIANNIVYNIPRAAINLYTSQNRTNGLSAPPLCRCMQRPISAAPLPLHARLPLPEPEGRWLDPGCASNDGFGGGADVHHNLLYNTCRESGDHGAFNSWDRLPYITTIATGQPSTVPALNEVHNNFIVANYAADGGCLDNDDGSAYYAIHHNFCIYGGHKQNFDGHDKHSTYNVYVYPQVCVPTA